MKNDFTFFISKNSIKFKKNILKDNKLQKKHDSQKLKCKTNLSIKYSESKCLNFISKIKVISNRSFFILEKSSVKMFKKNHDF